jgi:molybdenum cofactor cytidylyltransferase
VVVGIVLAAGSSSRLGRPKQLLPLAGRPLLAHVLDRARAGGLDRVVLVLGHRAGDVLGALALPDGGAVTTVLNPRHAEGQATSLRAGLEAAGPDADAAVVLLGDQPAIRPEAVRAVLDAFERGAGPVVQASYGGRGAHPTLLARRVWPRVLDEIGGDRGAREALRRHPEWRTLVEVGGAVPDDVDTEEDYRRVRAAFEGPASQ